MFARLKTVTTKLHKNMYKIGLILAITSLEIIRCLLNTKTEAKSLKKRKLN